VILLYREPLFGSQFGGRPQIAQSRRSAADLASRGMFVAVFDEAGFPLNLHVIAVRYDVMLLTAVPVHRTSNV
jgi:hypothetical protein